MCASFEPFPSNVGYIWYAPNHVRAFRASAYEEAGGYNPALDVLDDQDLMCLLYLVGPFVLIEECLYLQRVHARNTQANPKLNNRIQIETVLLYDHYIEKLALAWAEREGLTALDLGAAHNKPDGYLGVDVNDSDDVDIVADVAQGLDLPDHSVGVIRAVDFLEHVPDKVALFNELYRLLAHGGVLLVQVPSSDGRGAFQDPTHVSFYNENSFWYFTDLNLARFVPAIECRFQVSRLVTYFPNEWHEQHLISYVMANLVAVKDGPRLAGELLI
jgi:SAM-dependent methyltransferase